jgi:hypothetical protein
MTETQRPRRGQWRVTRLAGSLLEWCQDHPLPGTLALTVATILALFGIAQGLDWLGGKIWPPGPKVLNVESKPGSGRNFSVTIENPTDMSMIVSEAVFRSEPPPTSVNANALELLVPAVTYDVPFDCSPGNKRVKLNPPFKVSAKEVGAVVFRATVPMRPCQLYVSLVTSQGQTKEQEGVSLTYWRTKAP